MKSIKSRMDLEDKIAVCQKEMKKGILKNEGAGYWGTSFSKLSLGYIGDIVSNYFSCASCGQLFHLHAETYHGAGGGFEKIGSIDERLQDDI
ncbi:hypothetical protein [Duganella violaceipulchra]|nr:hypothetical protein [Duganella violaceicalia]